MDIRDIGYFGPDIDDPTLLGYLPEPLKQLLRAKNGWIQFDGGFHMRGACKAPHWHSLRAAWTGESAFHRFYRNVSEIWVPFAEDCMGDQFFWSGQIVARLDAETGDVFEVAGDIPTLLGEINDNPVATLALEPLLQFQREGGTLKPGELIHADPPFCTKESANGVALKAAPGAEVHAAHAQLAQTLTG